MCSQRAWAAAWVGPASPTRSTHAPTTSITTRRAAGKAQGSIARGTGWPRAGITGIYLISCLGKEHTLLEHACWVQRKLSLVPGRDCVWTSSSILTCCATCACNHCQLLLCALSSGSSDDALPAPACPSPFAGVYQFIPRLPFLPCRLAPLPSPVADSLLAFPTPLMLLAGG